MKKKKKENEFIVIASYIDVTVDITEHSLGFLLWFNNAFKVQYPHTYEDFEVNHHKREGKNDDTIQVLAWNRAITPEALFYMYDDYVSQEIKAQLHMKC